jgi:hypothetical protein
MGILCQQLYSHLPRAHVGCTSIDWFCAIIPTWSTSTLIDWFYEVVIKVIMTCGVIMARCWQQQFPKGHHLEGLMKFRWPTALALNCRVVESGAQERRCKDAMQQVE